jgi:hypothetical protein
VLLLAHKYNIASVQQRILDFLVRKTTTFSLHANKPGYVITWLALSEQLHLEALADRCLTFIRNNARGVDGVTARPEDAIMLRHAAPALCK